MNYDNQENSGYGFAVGMLCGVAVGAALGLLFAPTQGKELRGKIGEKREVAGQSVEGHVRDRAGARSTKRCRAAATRSRSRAARTSAPTCKNAGPR